MLAIVTVMRLLSLLSLPARVRRETLSPNATLRRHVIVGLALTATLLAVGRTHAAAQVTIESETSRRLPKERPQDTFALEIKAGIFTPQSNSAFEQSFNDEGPLIGGEIDAFFYQIPFVGPVGLGVGIAWANYSGEATRRDTGEPNEAPLPADCDDEASRPNPRCDPNEVTDLAIFPISILGVLRIDALPRYLNVPFTFGLKLGMDVVPWRSRTGGQLAGSGISLGLRWAAQVALELDFIDRRASKHMETEWGVNHVFLFFEGFGSHANSSFPLGNDFGWTAGLGFLF